MLLLLWPLAAFGGRSASTAIPSGLCYILLAVLVGPAFARRGAARGLDRIVLAIGVGIALQAVPLPSALVDLVSPHASVVRRELSLAPSSPSWRPLSIDEVSTRWAAVVALGTIALFFAAREVVARGGLRQTVRGISALGLIFSAIALAQAATAGRFIYWRFRTEYEGPLPFGPFVNRNHFATWVIMAIPLCVGYILARANTPDSPQAPFISRRAKLARLADGRTAWLAAAVIAMSAALLVSMSRSGILSLAGATVVSTVALRRRATARRVWWVAGLLVLALGFALTRADVPALAERFVQSRAGVESRVQIWRDTVPIVRDFWLTGTGAGTYRTAMLYYQRADRTVQFNQAHNHYLQIAAEDGLVLLGLVTVAMIALAGALGERLTSETTGAYWIRAGAACGLLAAALQSLWETGLVMPANAALAAVLGAIASHER